MDYQLKEPVNTAWLAKKMDLVMAGNDVMIEGVCSLQNPKMHGLCFAKNMDLLKPIQEPMIVIAPESIAFENYTTIVSSEPRLDFIKALSLLQDNVGFLDHDAEPEIYASVQLGQHVVIEKDVVIGEGSVIGHHVVIRRGTQIGKYCHIQSGAVIGEDGYGFERDHQGVPLKMVHLGHVEIGDRVHIGANTTICRGTLGSTIIENDVKIDNLVHIAHNCHIKSRAMIIACAEISGGVVVEEDTWIAPNASVRQKLTIGTGSLVGLGAVVVKNVLANTVVLGNPARQNLSEVKK